MKKILLLISICCLAIGAFAETPAATVSAAAQPAQQTRAEQKKEFKARRKQIRRLVKEYHKASAEEQAAIKEKLTALVSQSVDAGLAYVKARIAAEKANVEHWENKIREDEANLPALKAQRVEDLLSGAAKKKYKAARKEWKKQMKSLRK